VRNHPETSPHFTHPSTTDIHPQINTTENTDQMQQITTPGMSRNVHVIDVGAPEPERSRSTSSEPLAYSTLSSSPVTES